MIGIALMCINLGINDIFAMLTLPIQEMLYLSIYLIFFDFFRRDYSFQHVSPVHVLLDLHQSVSFLWVIVNDIVFLNVGARAFTAKA